MSDIEDIGTALPLVIKSVFELDERLKAIETDNMQSRCGAAAKANGWHARFDELEPGTDSYIEHLISKVALISSEATEAIEELRVSGDPYLSYTSNGKPEGFASELADIIIRSYDMAYMLNIPIDDVIANKLEFNKTRGQMHNGKLI